MIETAVLMCHAPIVVPAVGGRRGNECSTTTRAMRQVAQHVASSRPEVLLLLSPHARRQPASFGLSQGSVRLDFARFGAPDTAIELPGSSAARASLVRAAQASGVATHDLEPDPTDHGAAVPAYFLQEAGFSGPTIVISLPYPGRNEEARFGEAIARVAEASSQRFAIVASGDLSHRLIPGAPAGYHQNARKFDETFVGRIDRGDLRGACATDPALRDVAAEDAVDSTTIAAAAVDYDARGHELFAYEGPFGVGYAEAILYQRGAPPQTLVAIAKHAIEAMLEGHSYEAPELESPWNEPRAVFVTLREPDGQLRGCIGRTHPAERTLANEVASSARSAATNDPRFPPVTKAELGDLSFEVSVLEPPEPIPGIADLDPTRYGVVVSSGHRRGVLLPNVPGVDTAMAQVRIAQRKAGIDEREPTTLERFRVHKVSGVAP